MFRYLKIILILSAFFCLFTGSLSAKENIATRVMVIHASTESNHIDNSLKGIISELKSVFKYTSYRMLNDQRISQQFNQKGSISLPGNLTLVIIPTNMDGKRIQYQISIQKGSKSIFQTQVLLKNNSSITIGGPKYKNGYLLFNISGSVQ
jgi:hypothetical protein